MSLNAIYITDRFVRITQAIKEKATSFKEFELDISSLKKEDLPIQLAKFLKEKNITPDNLTLIIPRSQATIRYLTFPSVDEKEINRMVEYEVDNLFPYKKEELVIDSAVIEKRADGYSQVLVAAIKKADIDNQLLLLKQAGLVPDSIGLSSISIFNQFIQSFDYAQDKRKKTPVNYLLVNLEDNLLDIIIVCNGNLIFSRGVNLKQQEERIRLINETRNIISIHETKGISVEKLILTGRGINLNELAVSFEQAFGMKVEINQADCVTRGIMVPSTAKSLDIELLPEESKIHKLKDRIRKSVLYFIVLILLNASLIGNITF